MTTSKSIEKLAREINDNDVFIEHIGNIARRYRREHGLDDAERRRELAQALRTFHKHASALSEFLKVASRAKPSPEGAALLRIVEQLHGSTAALQDATRPVASWLQSATEAAAQVLETKRSAGEATRAQLIAAEALRATFEFHRLRFNAGTSSRPADAARLLLAMAKTAGDAVTYEQARAAIARVKQPQA